MATIRYSARNLSPDEAEFKIKVWADSGKSGGSKQKLLDKEIDAGKTKSKTVVLDTSPKLYVKIEVDGTEKEYDTDPDEIHRISVVYSADKKIQVMIFDSIDVILKSEKEP